MGTGKTVIVTAGVSPAMEPGILPNATRICPYPEGMFDNSPTFEGWVPRIYGCIESQRDD